MKLLDLSMYVVSMITYYFSVRGFGHPVFLKPHFGHPVMKILAKTLDVSRTINFYNEVNLFNNVS